MYLSKADKHGVKIVKHIKGGINPSSLHQLQFKGPHVAEAVKVGLISAVIALTVTDNLPYFKKLFLWQNKFRVSLLIVIPLFILHSSQEAIAVGRSFASIKGYHLDGNKEMMAMGFMNLAGSLTSCYVATGKLMIKQLQNV